MIIACGSVYSYWCFVLRVCVIPVIVAFASSIICFPSTNVSVLRLYHPYVLFWLHDGPTQESVPKIPFALFPTCVCPQERNMVMTSSILPSVGLACSAFCVEHDHGSVNGMQEYLYHDLGDLKKVKSTITFIL